MRKKILCIPPWLTWYVGAHVEYLIRELADEFFMEIATIPYPPYETYMQRIPPENPFMRNPDDFDLIWSMWSGQWDVPLEKYWQKMAAVIYQPGENRGSKYAVMGAATPLVEKYMNDYNIQHHSLRFGIDTNLFYPVPALRKNYCCNKFHVGYIGNHENDRHMLKPVISPLRDLKGIHLMIFPASWQNNGGVFSQWDGENLLPYVVTGNKLWTGLPNIYNRMDVLLRMDQDPAYSFPTLEAAACGVPVIATNSGIDHLITQAGGGILINGDRQYYIDHVNDVAKTVREKVSFLRDNKKVAEEMGRKGREEILKNWTWDKFINNWRLFFREGVNYAISTATNN